MLSLSLPPSQVVQTCKYLIRVYNFKQQQQQQQKLCKNCIWKKGIPWPTWRPTFFVERSKYVITSVQYYGSTRHMLETKSGRAIIGMVRISSFHPTMRWMSSAACIIGLPSLISSISKQTIYTQYCLYIINKIDF